MGFEDLWSGNIRGNMNAYIMMFPVIIIMYIITTSFIMKNIYGLVYIFGLILTLINIYAVSMMSSNMETEITTGSTWEKSTFCYIGLPLINRFFNNASPNAGIIIYTLFFFLMGDIVKHIKEISNPLSFIYFLLYNKPWLMVFFGIMFVLNIYAERAFHCNKNDTLQYFVGGGIIGLFSGLLLMIFFAGAGLKNLLHTNVFLQDSIHCVIPRKKSFRCEETSQDSGKVYFIREESNRNPYIFEDSLTPDDIDTYNIGTLKNYGDYAQIKMTGKTNVYFYEKKDRKGKMVKIDKFGTVTGKEVNIEAKVAELKFAAENAGAMGVKLPDWMSTGEMKVMSGMLMRISHMTVTELKAFAEEDWSKFPGKKADKDKAKKAIIDASREKLQELLNLLNGKSQTSNENGMREIGWSDLKGRFLRDWPALGPNFSGPKSILIHKEY